MKHILEHELGLFRSRPLQINPQKQIRVRQQCRHQKHFDVLAVQTSLRCKYERPNHLSHLSHSLRRVKLARILSRMGMLASMFGLSECESGGEGRFAVCRSRRQHCGTDSYGSKTFILEFSE